MLQDLKKSITGDELFEIEWIEIDNRKNDYKSASQALNYGFSISNGDFVIFLHQDIIFDSVVSLVTIINAAKNGSVIGVAGCTADKGLLISSIYDGSNKERKLNTIKKDEVKRVLTCDECLIAMKRDVFLKLGGFDEVNFDGWHFYVVDISLRANELEIPCVIVPVEIWHRSLGKKDSAWEIYENVLRIKYKQYFKKIYYPCGYCFTNTIHYKLDRLVSPMRKKIKRMTHLLKIHLRKNIYH